MGGYDDDDDDDAINGESKSEGCVCVLVYSSH